MAKGGYREGAGRPKAQHTIQAEAAKKALILAFLKKKAPIFKALLDKAEQGDIQAIKELFERVWGKESQPLSGDLNHILDVPAEVYENIIKREVSRIKVSGD